MAHENLEDGADILVHELGHNFKRQHTDCGVPDPDRIIPGRALTWAITAGIPGGQRQ